MLETPVLDATLAGETLTLLPKRAAFWSRERTLFIADTHFGKPASFRHSGLPVPEGVTGADLDTLSGVIERCAARRLVILGDLLHAPTGRAPVTMDAVAAWRHRHGRLEVMLVRGNHDRAACDPPEAWRFECVDPGACTGPFTLTHTPEEAVALGAGPAICGHVHPGVSMGDPATGASQRFACFFLRGNVLCLPAFGRFTGLGIMHPRATDRVFVIAAGEVIDVSPGGVPA
ncbi:MAG: ligase-associated DNA damage response endonuclease PdeM [Planctomycetes bacterium]|nr:ligase-associated DNA damage response endonuclease PdeM [Planctomycetota bacterium]